MRITLNGSAQMVVPNVQAAVEDLEQAKAEGFGTYWLAQVGLGDALTVLTAAGPHTAGMEVGTAVIATFPRHPSMLAGQALTTQAAIEGELVLGIGLAHKPSVEDNLGIPFDRPIRHMNDYLDVLLPLLETGRVAHTGDIWSADLETIRPTDRAPQVMLAALGEQMLRIAGSRTAGTILWLVGAQTIRDHIAPRINDAASAAGRPAPRVVASLPVCVTDDEAAGRQLIGRALDGYQDLPSYKAMLDREGAAGPADVAIVGDEAAVDAALDELADAGATEFAAVPLGADAELMARTRAHLAARNP